MQLLDLSTPALLLDAARMRQNIRRMRTHLEQLGVGFRPHLKTAKSIEVAREMFGAPRGPATVSTLKEAEQFFAVGVRDILYAVAISPAKLPRVAALRAMGCDLTIILDHPDTARAVSAFCQEMAIEMPVLLEIDVDGHRSGIPPESESLLETAAALTGGATLQGVMTHAGSSYGCVGEQALQAAAEQERAGAVRAASRLRKAGVAISVVSVGSTPTATFAAQLDGVTEVRAGVFVFQDLVMAGLGVCTVDDIALSVLVTVIGHQPERGWLITDGGWLAMSRDRGTARQAVDQGYGLVCDIDGTPINGMQMRDANQEHGILVRTDGAPMDFAAFPIGTRLRILPNHACATAAAFDAYAVIHGADEPLTQWDRFNGW